MPTIIISVQQWTEESRQCSRARKRIKYIRIRKEERKFSTFADMILYVEKLKEPTNKLLELKMVSQGCHLQSQYTTIVFLYISNKQKIKLFKKYYL